MRAAGAALKLTFGVGLGGIIGTVSAINHHIDKMRWVNSVASGKTISQTAPNPPALAPQCDQAADDDRAWCEFEDLTKATILWPEQPLPASHTISTESRPLWRNWPDKCDVGIDTCCAANLTACKTDVLSFKEKYPLLQNDITGVRRPVQSRVGQSVSSKKYHSVSSILFSPDLQAELASLSKAGPSGWPSKASPNIVNSKIIELNNSVLPHYATAVKLIWEVVTTDGLNPAYVYDPSNPPPEDVNAKILPPLLTWHTQYSLNRDESATCPDGALPPPSGQLPLIPLNCFYHYKIDTTNPDIQKQLIRNDSSMQPGNYAVSPDAMLILVGAHVMVLSPDRPVWQWMTFYWTPSTNGKVGTNGKPWLNPWRHYQMMTTSALREGSSLLNPTAIAANPYLEAHLDGTHANCLSCHSLAVSKTGTSTLSVARNKIVQPQNCKNGPAYPATEKKAITLNYFKGAIRTHFLWSLATVGAPPPPSQQPFSCP